MHVNHDRFMVATYRVQLTANFDFDQAAGIADYLAELGVSELYCSPYLQAAAGSTHGYDVLDHGKVSEELGGRDGHRRLCEQLARLGLGQIVDLVPNHMSIVGDNPLWWDVLANGPASRYASFFDIDWEVADPSLHGKVLLPVLHDRYGVVLRSGELRLQRQGEHVVLRYRDQSFPLSDESVSATAAHAPLEIDEFLARARGDPDFLDGLLERQHYRLAYWAAAGSAINYRRFFAISTLAGLRVENAEAFDHVHALVLEWVKSPACRVTALRVDHIDGLREPGQYLERLGSAAPDVRILVEKILEPDESLPESWPVAGTTGYDFLNGAGGLFVDPAGEEPLTRLYAEFTGEPTDYVEIIRSKKRQVLQLSFGGELDRLVTILLKACRARRLRDFVRPELREAVAELISAFPVYRTYASALTGRVSAQDEAYVRQAVNEARQRRGDIDGRIWDILADVLLLRWTGEEAFIGKDFAMRFQQLTGPVMAKGVEDTALYCFNRLVSLNEVGGDPGRFGRSVKEFHDFCQYIGQHWPGTLLATSTHDTKRSEDVRLRISLLSEIPELWAQAVWRWSDMTARYRRDGMPSRNAEYLLYQTLVGTWPISDERLVAYMTKAAREEKAHTTWERPDTAYEDALRGFVQGVLRDEAFMADIEAFVTKLTPSARVSSLSQTLIKCTAPGVPDFYQGTELWDSSAISLVDPDNRRSVDYSLRRRRLKELDGAGAGPEQVLSRMDEALPKLMVIQRALRTRRRRPDLFGRDGAYQPLFAQGRYADRVVAFSRGEGVITIAPRLLMGLDGWGDTAFELPPGRWHNEFTAEVVTGRVLLTQILGRFPVCLLTSQGAHP